MSKNPNSKRYDLEDRTLKFAKRVTMYVKELLRTIPNVEYGKQLVRSAGSVGANYIEANESLSKKDFIMRIKICRKEAKETCYWMKLTEPTDATCSEQGALIQESTELVKIFNAILEKSQGKGQGI
ncbi:MAG: four helix bundle protein [Deltaproteobacteria bacterium]|nr:four helix bundle protein [Deltaproteobacteria bacterium]